MCFNLCCNPQPRNCNRPNVIRGPRGPQGPQGPQGPAGLNNAFYARLTAGTIPAGTIFPIALNSATPTNTATISGGVAFLPSGYYLVTYYLDGTSETYSATLNLNGAPVSTLTTTETTEQTLSKTIMIYAPTNDTTLSITNTGTTPFTVTDVGLTVVKLA